MEGLVNKIHREVSEYCKLRAESDCRDYYLAAWFEQNGIAQIQEQIEMEEFHKWLTKAEQLGYELGDVQIKTTTDFVPGWSNIVWSYKIKVWIVIENYGEFRDFCLVRFPSKSELSKAFLAPHQERERIELAKKAEKEAEESRIWAEKKAEKEAEKARIWADKKAEIERIKHEKKTWISQHGSNYLKRAIALEYNCEKEYLTERAAIEIPGFMLDWEGKMEWQTRPAPSPKALDLVEEIINDGHNAKVVWLTNPPDQDESEIYEACEALIIFDYLLGKNLVKVITL